MTPHSRRYRFSAVLAGLALIATACASGGAKVAKNAPAAQSETSLASVCAAGVKEGTVLYRTGGDASTVDAEMAVFEKSHPGITVKYTSMKPQDDMQSVLAETQARHTLTVDMTGADIPSTLPVLKAGLVADINWKALGVPDALLLKIQDVTLYRQTLILGGLSYDSKRLTPADLPDTWDALIDPKWAGQVIVDPRGKFLSTMALAWGEDKTIAWYKQLLKVDKAVSVQGESDSLTKVISGESKLSTSGHNAQVAETNHGSGTSLAVKYLDVIPAEAQFPIVFKGAPHPNAARCLAGWMNSPEGRATTAKYEFSGPDIPQDVPSTTKVVFDNSLDTALLDADVATQLAKLTTSS